MHLQLILSRNLSSFHWYKQTMDVLPPFWICICHVVARRPIRRFSPVKPSPWRVVYQGLYPLILTRISQLRKRLGLRPFALVWENQNVWTFLNVHVSRCQNNSSTLFSSYIRTLSVDPPWVWTLDLSTRQTGAYLSNIKLTGRRSGKLSPS